MKRVLCYDYVLIYLYSNRVSVEFLPVYAPTEEEKIDAKLFARNVRAMMAARLQVCPMAPGACSFLEYIPMGFIIYNITL